MLHTSLLSLGERSCKPVQESLARNAPLHSQAAVTCWAGEEGIVSKTCCFSGIPLCLYSKQRAAPGQPLL